MHGLPKTRNDEKQGFVMTQIFPNRIVDEFPIFSMNFLAGRLKHESPQPEAYPEVGDANGRIIIKLGTDFRYSSLVTLSGRMETVSQPLFIRR